MSANVRNGLVESRRRRNPRENLRRDAAPVGAVARVARERVERAEHVRRSGGGGGANAFGGRRDSELAELLLPEVALLFARPLLELRGIDAEARRASENAEAVLLRLRHAAEEERDDPEREDGA